MQIDVQIGPRREDPEVPAREAELPVTGGESDARVIVLGGILVSIGGHRNRRKIARTELTGVEPDLRALPVWALYSITAWDGASHGARHAIRDLRD